jgi:predicted Zn-dependent protease
VTRAAALLCCAALLGCAGGSRGGDDYLRYVAVQADGFEPVLLRWQTRQMPLKVYLPPPPAAATEDPEAVLDAVRDGFMDWADVAAPGVPSFSFVATPGEADIPVAWETEPSGDWFIAHTIWDIDIRKQRFGVARILVLTRRQGVSWSLDDLYLTMLHEVGHALGLGHSPEPLDIMYKSLGAGAIGVSARDRATLARLYSLPIGHRVGGARRAD